MIEELRSLPIRQKVGQMFCIGIGGPSLDEMARDLVAEVSPGGFCLFSRNIRDRLQTRELLDSIRKISVVSPILSVDQEGGLVDRLRRIMTPMPAANKLRSGSDADKLAKIIAETLLILGFNVDFAPVVDVIDDERASRTNGLSSREFGRSRDDVVTLAGQFLSTLQQCGITGCLKHFPGLGAATVDSHEELPVVQISEEEFESIDLYPYRQLIAAASVRAIMVAHASFPRINLQEFDGNGKLLPSSLSSKFINGLLRDVFGFSGLVITDDLEMGAILRNYGIGDACVMAVDAGADMLAICAEPANIREAFTAILSAVESGQISEERLDISLERIAEFKMGLSLPRAFDNDRLDRLSDEIMEFDQSFDQN